MPDSFKQKLTTAAITGTCATGNPGVGVAIVVGALGYKGICAGVRGLAKAAVAGTKLAAGAYQDRKARQAEQEVVRRERVKRTVLGLIEMAATPEALLDLMRQNQPALETLTRYEFQDIELACKQRMADLTRPVPPTPPTEQERLQEAENRFEELRAAIEKLGLPAAQKEVRLRAARRKFDRDLKAIMGVE